MRVAGALAALAAAAVAARRARPSSTPRTSSCAPRSAERQPDMEARLADWVGRNTGTWNAAGLEAFAPLVAAELRALDFEVTIEPSAPLEYPDRKDARTGPLIVAERKATVDPEHARHFLLLGHFDTVFEPDSPFQKWRDRRRARPTARSARASSDMKGGLVVLLYALRALRGERRPRPRGRHRALELRRGDRVARLARADRGRGRRRAARLRLRARARGRRAGALAQRRGPVPPRRSRASPRTSPPRRSRAAARCSRWPRR